MYLSVEVVRMDEKEEAGQTEVTDKEEKEDKEKDGEKNEEDKEQEVVLIQDTGFNVTVVVPGVEEFELAVRLIFVFHSLKTIIKKDCVVLNTI